ncbi:MAG: phosphatidylinositol-specific phospholipase C/glycerophosphodiester phosphodiesterase family protein [Aeoliella sp.]
MSNATDTKRYLFSQLLAVAVLLAAGSSLGAEDASPGPLTNAHAHNDYDHPRPLLDALDHGFCSVEADVFLINGELLVGHDEDELSPQRTLKKLYLDPLQERVEQRGEIYPKHGPPLTLLVDIKSDGASTFAALHELFTEYSDMLSVVVDDQLERKAVSVVISGNRPEKEIAASNPRYVGIDGRLSDLERDTPGHLMPLVSDNWFRHFQWRGRGTMPEAEQKRLREIVTQAHEQGRRVRFWATPEDPKLWKELLEAGVDLIGTDDLGGLQEYLSSRSAE